MDGNEERTQEWIRAHAKEGGSLTTSTGRKREREKEEGRYEKEGGD